MSSIALLHWPHFWFLLGALFLLIELIGVNGYALVAGISSWITWLLIAFLTNTWFLMLFFLTLLIILSGLLYLWDKTRNKPTNDMLNKKKYYFLGHNFVLTEDTNNNRGRIKINDGSWPIRSSQELKAGTHVVVTDMDGLILQVEPSQNQSKN